MGVTDALAVRWLCRHYVAMGDGKRSRWAEIGNAWADGLTDVAVNAGRHIGLVATILLFGALELIRQRTPVHMEGASAKVAQIVLVIAEVMALAKGVVPHALGVLGDIGEAGVNAWHRIRPASKQNGNGNRHS